MTVLAVETFGNSARNDTSLNPMNPDTSIGRRIRENALLLILAGFIIIAATGASTAPLRWDEGSFLHNAEVLLGEDTRLEDNRPIALSVLFSVLWTVTGESVMAARLLVALFGLGCLLVFSRITEEYGIEVVAAFAFAPLFAYWSFHTYTDVPALFFLLLGWWFYREQKPVHAGIALGVATTFRYLFAVFALSFAVAYVYERRNLLSYSLGGVTGSAPFFLHSWWRYGSVLAKPRIYVNRVGQWSSSGLLATPVESATAGVTMLAGLIPAAALVWEQMDAAERAAVTVYPAFLLLYVGNPFTRYWLPLIPFLLLATRRGCSRKWFAVAAASMLVFSGAVLGQQTADQYRCQGPFENAMTFVRTETAGPVVSDRWAEASFHLDRPVHSPWTDYTTLRSEHGVEHVITADNLSYPVAARFSNRCVTYTVYRLVD